MDIELRLLRSFVQIHEAGSISRAAERLGCTQAAMSMRLKMLETEIGGPLFLRQPTGLAPTLRGAELYAKALAVLSAYDEMVSTTRLLPAREKLRIGMPDDYALGFLPAVLKGFDGAELEITCDLSANLMTGVERGEIDLALVTLAARPVLAVSEISVPLQWVGYHDGAGHAARIVAYPEGCVFRRAMTQALDQAGLAWQIVAQSRSHAGIFASIRAGLGVTAVAKGSAPPEFAPDVGHVTLPALPSVPLYLTIAPMARNKARRLADRLAQHLSSVTA